ncbi:glucosyltransferase domain-containing protein [Huaxiibacter chinensis]|uniref:glucosyltransferase domain-containing protein n=1 Tax=Huaxiibacter chinensis TaxID=2899785 RepID=UPI003D312CAC
MLKNNVYIVWLFVICAVIYYLPELTQTYYFNDDIGRNAIGYGLYDNAGWGEYADSGRPAAEVLIRLLSGWVGRAKDVLAVDLAPLTKLLSALSVAATAWIIYRKVMDHVSWVAFMVALSVVFSPWFIHCIQYSFDSVTMGCALLLTVLPFISPKNTKSCVFFFICYFISLCFYQLFLVSPFLIIIFIVFKTWLEDGKVSHEVQNYYGCVIISLMASFIAYKAALMLFPIREYALIHSKMLTLSIILPAQVVTRMVNLIDVYFSPFYGVAGIVLVGLYLLALTGVAAQAKASGRSVWLVTMAHVTLSVIVVLVALLPQALLREPVYAGRTMAGNQFVLLIWLFPLIYLRAAFFKHICVLWVIFFILMAALNAAITNAIRAQYNYEDRLLNVILTYPMHDVLPVSITYVPPFNAKNKIWLRQARNVRTNFPFAKYVLHNTYMLSTSIWATRQTQLYNREVVFNFGDGSRDFCQWPDKLVMQEFILYGKGDRRYVDFSKTACDGVK